MPPAAETPRILALPPVSLIEQGEWPAFAAKCAIAPLEAWIVPYRVIGETVEYVDAQGNPGGRWWAASKVIEHTQQPPWTKLHGGAWRLGGSLEALGLDRNYCDGGVVLFIVKASKTGVFGQPQLAAGIAAAADAGAGQDRVEEVIAAVEAVDPHDRQRATVPWTTHSAGPLPGPGGAARAAPGRPAMAPEAPAADPVLHVALASCQYPGGVLDRTAFPHRGADIAPDRHFVERPGPADRSRRALGEWLSSAGSRLLVWAGDSIYIDATAGLFDPALGVGNKRSDGLRDTLHRAYDSFDNSKFAGTTRSRLQAIDDHEIIDNWEPSLETRRDRALRRRLDLCRSVFIDSVLGGALAQAVGDSPVPLWRRRVPSGFPHLRFFVADTRTERCARTPAHPNDARIMSQTQFDALLGWLGRAEDEAEGALRQRIIVAPPILLPRHLATQQHAASAWRSDSWDGYPRSFHDLLAVLAEQDNLLALFLSGDEHLPCLVAATVQRLDESRDPTRLLSVHTGAMYAPFPFANGRPEEFSDEDEFSFDSWVSGTLRRYRCTLQHRHFPPGVHEGFVAIELGKGAEPKIAFHANRPAPSDRDCDGTDQTAPAPTPLWP